MSKGAKKEQVSLRGLLRSTYGTLAVSLEGITDRRKKKVIPTDTVAKAMIIGGGILGTESLRHLDGVLRHASVRELTGGSASDSTLSRVCAGLEGLQGSLKTLGQGLCHGKKRTRLGIIDGSSLGAQLASVLIEPGLIPRYWGFKLIPKHGKELPVSLDLLRHHRQAGFQYLLADGLYACQRFWEVCDDLKCFGLVKNPDLNLTIIQQAESLFNHPVRGKQVGYQLKEGVEAKHAVHYRIWQTTGLWSNTRRRLTVARVEETFLKGPRLGQTDTFRVLCQDLAIDPEKLRDLAHGRWFIENNGFKALNEQTHRKHLFSHHPHTAAVIAAFQMMGMMVLAAYRARLAHARHRLRSLFDHGQLSFRLLRSHLWGSLLPASMSP
jgi:hypothetical protein